MIETWVVVTVAAAFLQNARSALQKHLKGAMGTTGATFTRFGFGLPVALVYFAVTLHLLDAPLPGVNGAVLGWVLIGAAAQIGATALLVHLFSLRNFAVGNAYARTEPMQTALFASVLFGAEFGSAAIAAIVVAVIGVMVVSVARTTVTPRTLATSLFRRTALIGLAAGTLFGLAAVGFQQATRSVAADHIALQAATTLVIGLAIQTVVMGAWIVWREPDEIVRIRSAWRASALVGLAGATATFGWFTAFTLQEAALVKVVAQVEMLFAILSSVVVFGEKVDRLELLGCTLIVVSILMLVSA